MAKLLRTLMSLAFVLGAAAVVVPGTATAADTAYNTKTQYLTGTPNSGMAGSCVSRSVYLAAGYYDWGHRMGTGSSVGRANLYLGADWYTWADCLDPGDGIYGHGTTLKAVNHSWPRVEISRTWRLSSSGTYTWGSFLDPRF